MIGHSDQTGKAWFQKLYLSLKSLNTKTTGFDHFVKSVKIGPAENCIRNVPLVKYSWALGPAIFNQWDIPNAIFGRKETSPLSTCMFPRISKPHQKCNLV